MRATQPVFNTRRENASGGWRGQSRGRGAMPVASWSRNYNTVRHEKRTIGPVSNTMILGVLVLIVGLIYVAQGTQVTNYDYKLSEIDDEIAELTAKKEDLAVERARLTSIASSESSTVAANMEVASVDGYVEP